MNPIGNVYPIGAYAAEFRRRKPMLSGTKKKISRALKRLRKNPVFTVASTLAAGAVIPVTQVYVSHQNRTLRKNLAAQSKAEDEARRGAWKQKLKDDYRDLNRERDRARAPY